MRERHRDVLVLAGHFLELNRRRLGLRGIRLDSSVREALLHYDWPGNVRELEHLISRAVLRARARFPQEVGSRKLLSIGLEVLDLSAPETCSDPVDDLAVSSPDVVNSTNLREATAHFQRRLVSDTLHCCDGNQSRAARELGLDRGNFSRLIKRLGVNDQRL